MRFGDINKDGYPDMLITLIGNNLPMTYLLLNSDCTGVEGFNSTISRGFTLDNSLYGELNNVTSNYASFFDFGEQGYLKRFFWNYKPKIKEI